MASIAFINKTFKPDLVTLLDVIRSGTVTVNNQTKETVSNKQLNGDKLK